MLTPFTTAFRLLPVFLALCFLPAGPFTAPVRAAVPVVRFVQPRNLSTVTGRSEFVLALNLPSGARIRSLKVEVDGEPAATLTGPPWHGTWDAGDGSRGHRLTATLLLNDGTTYRAAVRTMPIRIQEEEDVDLVNLFAVVRNRRGEYITDLTRDRFTLREDGVPQKIKVFSTEPKPLAVAIVLDNSISMKRGEKLEAARKSALRFLDTLGKEDRVMLLTFNNRVKVLQPPTLDHKAMARAIEAIGPWNRGGTALYDGIWRAADYLRRLEGRRVLVLLTDGRDEDGQGFEPGSLHTLSEASDHANRNDVMIFAVGYGRDLKQLDIYQRATLKSILEKLANRSGGAALFPRRIGSLKGAFETVTRDLRHQYNIAYVSNNKERNGKWRTIELKTDTKGQEVITRKGYFAPGGEEEEDSAP